MYTLASRLAAVAANTAPVGIDALEAAISYSDSNPEVLELDQEQLLEIVKEAAAVAPNLGILAQCVMIGVAISYAPQGDDNG